MSSIHPCVVYVGTIARQLIVVVSVWLWLASRSCSCRATPLSAAHSCIRHHPWHTESASHHEPALGGVADLGALLS